MATANSPPVHTPEEEPQSKEHVECAVCLQPCVHPAQLPCTHVFCFLCVKGIAKQSKRCPLCRQEIPDDFIERPKILHTCKVLEDYDGYQWFYEGRNNGWWQYDAHTRDELEQAYKQGYNDVTLLICGELYVIDLVNHVQYAKQNPSRKRNIKRDLPSNVTVRGTAGLT